MCRKHRMVEQLTLTSYKIKKPIKIIKMCERCGRTEEELKKLGKL